MDFNFHSMEVSMYEKKQKWCGHQKKKKLVFTKFCAMTQACRLKNFVCHRRFIDLQSSNVIPMHSLN